MIRKMNSNFMHDQQQVLYNLLLFQSSYSRAGLRVVKKTGGKGPKVGLPAVFMVSLPERSKR